MRPCRRPESFPATGPNALARPWTRAVARLADTAIVSAPFMFIVVVVLAITGDLNDDEFPLWVRPMWAVFAVAYEAPLVAWRGQTVGKLALGIKVARLDNGRPPLWWQATMRIGLPAVLIVHPAPDRHRRRERRLLQLLVGRAAPGGPRQGRRHRGGGQPLRAHR